MKLHSTILGEGTPFLILHGFLGMSDNWKTLGKQFSEAGYQVHLIDQRNHGRSPHSSDFNYLELAKDIKEYCENHSLPKCLLLGHSMGGKTAMFTATSFPDLVEKLIVADISPKYYAPHHQQILKGLHALEENKLASRGEAEEIISKYVKEKGVQLFLLKNLYWKSKGELALRLNLEILSEQIDNLGEALPEDKTFAGQTLFIKGENSDYISNDDQNLIEHHFPSATLKTIPNSGHWVHAENPKVFYAEVMAFLSGK
ncbi:MAG TPA: alpha/beta fold hydrolase [Salinimicrobium sp.]|nr:alpha/beta fold hydrolase [Salinimicrobium sp.]